jgi:hypothetical protein
MTIIGNDHKWHLNLTLVLARVINYTPRVMLQIDGSRGIIYDRNMFTVQATSITVKF